MGLVHEGHPQQNEHEGLNMKKDKIMVEDFLKTKSLKEFIKLETNGKNGGIKSKREFYDYLRLIPENQTWRGLYPKMISRNELVIKPEDFLVIKHLRDLGFDFPLRVENIWIRYDEKFNYSILKELGVDKDLLIYIEREDDVKGIHPIIKILEDETVSSIIVEMTCRTLLLNYSFDEEMITRISLIINELYKRNNLSVKAKNTINQLSKFFSVNSIIIGSLLVGEKINSEPFNGVYSNPIYIEKSFLKLKTWFDNDTLKEYYLSLNDSDSIENKEMFKWAVEQKLYVVSSVISEITYSFSQSHYDKYKLFINKFINDDTLVKLFSIVNDYEYEDFVKNLKKMDLDPKKYPKTFSMLMDEPEEII